MTGQELSHRVHVNGVVGPTVGDKKLVLMESYEGSSGDGNLSQKDDGLGEVKVTDLVWGKVKSHPWWPGMVFDPSASTNKAMKYFKKDGLLIAYFGDKSFAWNEACNVKPFRLSFGEMAGQTDDESFCRGVDSALHEVGRRAEVGLACKCVSEEAWSKIKSCVVVNPGIKKGFSRIDCGDRFSTVESFKPVKVVDSVLDLATNPFGVNRLDVSTVGGQLAAFNRWKGNHQLQISNVLDESDDKFADDGSVVKKGKLNACGKVSKKRKHLFNGDLSPSKKVKCLSDLMSNGGSNESDEEYKPKRRGRKRKAVEPNRSSEEIQSSDEFLSKMRLAAINPIQRQQNLDSLVKFANEFRSYRVKEEKNDVDQMEEIVTNGFRGIKDSYWPDRIIVTKSVSPKPKKEDLPTALIFKFSNLDSVPSLKKMNEIFSRYGPLKEEETRLLKRKKCIKVVYERRSDAETAFSSSGKFSIFGPALVSYCLDFKPTLGKSAAASKKKGVKSGKVLKFED
ncbi:PWWP domain-containing protein [Artemisia annua]|uniref:PWWP domain-containing protein n=1 Tax=Artemisia annua TaxID=35608 RepID=A0A2U1N1S1_ARTAN|nr:PWWP domain-containing protein [Artemisia annua]